MKKVSMYSAKWCGPCRAAKPVFLNLRDAVQGVEFEVVDIDENPEMASNANISGVPTFVVYEDDVEVQRLIGGDKVTQLKQIL